MHPFPRKDSPIMRGVRRVVTFVLIAVACCLPPSPADWAQLRDCESGGNYRAISATGKYRGAYQFTTGTWVGVGGSGDPAAASVLEQDYRAALLYTRSGRDQWPLCGRFLPDNGR